MRCEINLPVTIERAKQNEEANKRLQDPQELLIEYYQKKFEKGVQNKHTNRHPKRYPGLILDLYKLL
jgi:hypothetical protein